MNIIYNEYPTNLPLNTYIAIDSEWFGLNQNQMHRPISGRFGCMTLCYEPENVYFIDDPKLVPDALKAVDNCIWVMHNAKFDTIHLRRLADILPRKKLWCTLLMERILWGGYFEFFALEHLVRRYLSIELDKSPQSAFTEDAEWTDELIQYSALDAHYTLLICQEQRKYVTKSDMRIWHEVDRPALFAYLDFQGFRIDVQKWKALAIRNKQRADEIDAELGFNPRSYKVVKDKLRKTGFRGLPSTGEKVLAQYILKKPDTDAAKLAKLCLESRKFSKYASTYGVGMIDKFLEKEDKNVYVLMSNYHPVGAETGRSASSDPNMKNIPVRDTNEFRECFIARPGNKVVILDVSQQEPRISAYLSQDKQLIKATQEDDVYIGTAKIRYKDKSIQKDDPRRKKMKAIFLGLSYGLSVYGLAEKEEISLDEAEEMIEEFFRTFQTMDKWMKKQGKEKTSVKTVLGRKVWLNPYGGQSERNA